jgi:hypothetical protein
MKDKKKHVLMAQTTPDASFGFVSSSPPSIFPPVTYIVDFKLYKTLVSIDKTRKTKKTRTNGPNNASDVVWAHFHFRHLPSFYPSRIS